MARSLCSSRSSKSGFIEHASVNGGRRHTRSLLLAGALVLGLSGSALALSLTATKHLLRGNPAPIAWEIGNNPERMFGPSTVSNLTGSWPSDYLPRGYGSEVTREFDTTAYWAAGVPSVHVKMTVRNLTFPCYFCTSAGGATDTYELIFELSDGAQGFVRHKLVNEIVGTTWKNDYTYLDSGKGPVETALLQEVHNLVVIPNVTALAIASGY